MSRTLRDTADRFSRSLANAAVVVATLALGLAACLGGRSRVREGQLYTAGTPSYDTYFREVHGLQAEAPKWGGARTASRKPLCDELKTPCDGPDATLAQLTHERMVEVARVAGPLSLELVGDDARMVATGGAKSVPSSARTLFRAVEITAKSELDRGRRMRATSLRVDQLVRAGRAYDERVGRDFSQKNVGKASEVRTELAASIDVLVPYSGATRAYAQGAEDFVLDLKRAIVTASAMPAAPTVGGPGPSKLRAPTTPVTAPTPPSLPSITPSSTPVASSKAAAPVVETDATSAKPAPKKPAAAQAEEVFNP